MATMVLLVLANLFSCVNMIIWRNNMRDIPIYADIVAHWWSVFPQLLYVNFACLAKFVWYMSRPGSGVFLYDNRRKINRIDAIMLGVAFLLLVPCQTFAFYGRYSIMEDWGPWSRVYLDMKLILIGVLPQTLMVIMSTVFNVMTLRNIIMHRRKGFDKETRIGSNARINKYLFLAISSSIFMLFGNIWSFYPLIPTYLSQISDRENFPYIFVPISDVVKTMHRKTFVTRFMLDLSPDVTRSNGGFFLSIPVVGMYFFAFFGLGKEARKMHRDNIRWIAHLVGWRWQSKESSRSSDPEKSFFPRGWRSLAIFRRVLPSNRSRRVPVAPFELPSNSSSQPLEKVVLDIGPHMASRARLADQNDEDHSSRLSMHKPLPQSPSQSPTTSNDEQSQSHDVVSSVKGQTLYPFAHPPTGSTGDVVQTGVQSLSRPQRKPPLPPPSRDMSSIDYAEQGHPQFALLPVPPPAYSRERQYWV
ncbi:hypothetical protein CPB86DRAFT_785972 [Serendipita vermifera]|nr:hypothetical protein CPB86DRAFT_785972 [Serendipita vermifera]